MDITDWSITLLGVSLVVVALLDVFLTILHIDLNGPVATTVQRALWRITVTLATWSVGVRRPLVALAGPVMLAATFLAWIALFVFGYALIVWPRLDAYRTEPEIGILTFVDALYYTGVTATVLGYGDITPLTPGLKILTFVMSGLGFALLTGIITYLLNVLSGVTERNKLTLRVRSETGWTGDGVNFVVRSLQGEEIADLRGRFDALVEETQNLQEVLHHYPIIDLYYRAQNPDLDPEPLVRTLVEMAIAGRLLSRDDRARRIGPIADDLGQSVSRIIAYIAEQYLGQNTRRRIEQPEPGEEDRAYVAAVAVRLERRLGDGYVLTAKGVDDLTLALACRSRVFLEAVEPLTRWRADHDWGRDPANDAQHDEVNLSMEER